MVTLNMHLSFSYNSCCYVLWSVSLYWFRHFLTKFNENTHACQRSTVEINTRGKIQDFFIDTSSVFTQRNEHERKQIFQLYHPGFFLSLAIMKAKLPHTFFLFFDCVFKPEAFKYRKSGLLFYSNGWT